MSKAETSTALTRRSHRSVAMFSICIALTALAGCSRSGAAPGPEQPKPIPVSVVRAQQADVPLTGDWVGTLDGYVNAQIQPQVSGYLIRQNYREGSLVSKGQVLFEIDPRPFQAVVEQAEGQLAQAQAQVAQAEGQVGQAQAQLEFGSFRT